MAERFHHAYLETKTAVGTLLLGASERGLCLLSFASRMQKPEFSKSSPFAGEWVESETVLRPYAKQLREYFAGQRKQFDMPLDLRGTDFQKTCWQALVEIPYGETRCYADIAKRVDSPKGFRAVGMANNRNPIAIVVPCHRVLGADGTLWGYGGGLPAKEFLLKLEGAEFKVPSQVALAKDRYAQRSLFTTNTF